MKTREEIQARLSENSSKIDDVREALKEAKEKRGECSASLWKLKEDRTRLMNKRGNLGRQIEDETFKTVPDEAKLKNWRDEAEGSRIETDGIREASLIIQYAHREKENEIQQLGALEDELAREIREDEELLRRFGQIGSGGPAVAQTTVVPIAPIVQVKGNDGESRPEWDRIRVAWNKIGEERAEIEEAKRRLAEGGAAQDERERQQNESKATLAERLVEVEGVQAHAKAEMQRVEVRQTKQDNRERGFNDREAGSKVREETLAQLKAAADESLAKVEQARQVEEAAARERAELYAQSLQKSREDIDAANRSLVELQEKIRARQIEMEEVTAKLTKVRSDLAATMADITIEEVGDAKTTDPTSAPIVPDSQPTTQFLERIFDKQGFPRLRLLMETDSFEQISNLLQTVEQLGAQKATQYVSLQTAMRGAPPEQISWLRYSLQRVADQSELFEQLGAALRIILNLKLEVAGLNTAIHRLEDRLEVLREEKGVSVVHSWNTAARLGQLFRTTAMPVAGIVLLVILALGVITYRAEIGRIASSVSETTPKPAATKPPAVTVKPSSSIALRVEQWIQEWKVRRERQEKAKQRATTEERLNELRRVGLIP